MSAIQRWGQELGVDDPSAAALLWIWLAQTMPNHPRLSSLLKALQGLERKEKLPGWKNKVQAFVNDTRLEIGAMDESVRVCRRQSLGKKICRVSGKSWLLIVLRFTL